MNTEEKLDKILLNQQGDTTVSEADLTRHKS